MGVGLGSTKRDREILVDAVLDALSSIEHALLIVDRDAQRVYASPAWVALFGLADLAPDPGRWSEEHGLYRPDEATLFAPEELPLRRALEGQPSRDVAMFVRNALRPGGVHVSVSCAPVPDRARGGSGAVCFLRPIPSRDRLLSEAEQQRKAILDNIRDMAWLKDRDGRFVAVNQASVEMYDRPLEEWIGQTDYDVYPRELAERFRADDEEVMKLGAQRCVEERIVDSDGREHWFETIKAPVFGEHGEIIGTTGTARDITARKRAAEVLRSTNDELERRVAQRTRALAQAQQALVRRERLAVLGSLAGGVAHQLRNPLAAIMNATAIVTHHLRASPSADVAEAIRVTQEEIRHADVIIRGLLDFARIRSPNRQPTSIAALLDRVLRAHPIPDAIEVRCDVLDDAELLIDAEQLESAISNIVINAVEAMPEGGVLGIRAFGERDRLVIAITDTGPGVPHGLGEQLFEPLRTTKPDGIGLGLATARTFIEAQGGSLISVDVPHGARFEIRLPLRDTLEPSRREPVEKSTGSRGAQRRREAESGGRLAPIIRREGGVPSTPPEN